MIVVNLFGAPCAGKSTAAAYIFSMLKMKGINVELVTEYVKDMVYDKNDKAINNQLYLFSNQYYKMDRLRNEVDVIVTDSPLPLNIVYNKNCNMFGDCFYELVMNCFKSFYNLSYLLKPLHGYKTDGRIHTQQESDALYEKIRHLCYTKIPPTIPNRYEIVRTVDSSIYSYDVIVTDVINTYIELSKNN